ncbi:hypothetical protein [Methanothermococcus sp.]|uniref:hypothetical protein n=1 Tax=Methanothermococcus sp. TaxID=2614238 RepID=UPI0025DFC16A|nr:hypothetical protein [Methanothermococcus sp.]
MGISIYEDTKIYICLPSTKITGGIELLHQLTYHLRTELNIESYLYYPFEGPEPYHDVYKNYNNIFIHEIEDSEKNILIYPEIYWIKPIMSKFKKIRKVLWWLSVDNFIIYKILFSKRNFFIYRLMNKIGHIVLNKQIFDIKEIMYQKFNYDSNEFVKIIKHDSFVKLADYHMVQSFYAKDILEKSNIKKPIYYLSDYLNKDFLKIKTDLSQKQNIVAYNPKKGYSFTKKIIKAAPDIEFIPIINMTRDEVIKTLQKAKVYIDFGNHPGKDRIPREAAILRCCVITGKRGSARYYEDVPIPEAYKFEDQVEYIPNVINKIKDCFENFEKRCCDFDYYRRVINEEPDKFVSNLKQIFK